MNGLSVLYPGEWARQLVTLCGPRHGCSSPGKVCHMREWPEIPRKRRVEGITRESCLRELRAAEGAGQNIGLVAPDDCIILDADDDRSAELLLRGSPADAPVQRTGRGVHVVLRLPKGITPTNRTKVEIEAGCFVDVRGKGAMIVCEPSIHVSGRRYTWERGLRLLPEIPLIPNAWLRAVIQSTQMRAAPASARPDDRIPEGQRNALLHRLGRSMHAQRCSLENIRAALHARNARSCVPPLADAEVENIARAAHEQADRADFGETEGGRARESIGDRALRLAEAAGVECFRDPGGRCYVRYRVEDHVEVQPARSLEVEHWLRAQLFAESKAVASREALAPALLHLESRAQFGKEVQPVFVRMGSQDGAVYLDLCDSEWQVVEVRAAGWRVIPGKDAPVRFRRSRGMLPLPIPVSGGDLKALQQFMHVDESGWILLVAWLVAGALSPRGAYPVLLLRGEQGSSKSTTARLLRSLIDPNGSPLRAEPRDPRDLMIAADKGWIVVLDNVSRVKPWLSDALCLLSTGGGLSTRTLYTDGDETVLDAKRPVIVTSIEQVATRDDLLDRSLPVELLPIRAEERRSELELDADFDAARPALLGALLDALSTGIAERGTIRPGRLHRLADFELRVLEAEPALPWPPGAFPQVYDDARRGALASTLDGPLAITLLAWMRDRAEWRGTATELLEHLLEQYQSPQRSVPAIPHASARAGRRERWPPSSEWPRTPRRLSGMLRRLKPALRAEGLQITFAPEGRGNTRRRGITIEWISSD
jgi:hypothetical protein